MKSRPIAVLMIAGLFAATQAGSTKPPKHHWTGATMIAFSGAPSAAATSASAFQ